MSSRSSASIKMGEEEKLVRVLSWDGTKDSTFDPCSSAFPTLSHSKSLKNKNPQIARSMTCKSGSLDEPQPISSGEFIVGMQLCFSWECLVYS